MQTLMCEWSWCRGRDWLSVPGAGLVWAVAAPDALQDEARRCAQRLASLGVSVVRHFKRVLNHVGLPAFERAIQEETSVQRSLQAVPVTPLARPER